MHHSKFARSMSLMGQKAEHDKSVHPPITDIRADIVDGSEVPIADINYGL